MSHPARGLPPATSDAPHAPAAAQLRAAGSALAVRALASAVARDPDLATRHDEAMLRLLVRDCERHLEQLARALETGRDAPAVEYASWIVPVMRRRGVSMGDLGTLFRGVADTARQVVDAGAGTEVARLADAMVGALERPRHLPGDRPRNPPVGFFWKAGGFAGW